MRRPSTPRQLEVLAAIARFRAERGYAPTVRELGALIGASSTNSTTGHLEALRRDGLVTWAPRSSRTLTLTEEGQRAVEEHLAQRGAEAC